MGISAADMQRLFGRCILFVGVEAQHWTVSTFASAARAARSWGVDTIAPKRADGSIKWYDTPAQLEAERRAVLAEGVGYAPFLYSYGPKFGDHQIHDECAVLAEMMHANDGCVIVDMETEWDGQAAKAELFEQLMRPVPGVLGVTTWADPQQQDWEGVIQALAPCVNLWIPQRYDNWLAGQPLPPEATIIQPGVDLSSEFGPNNVLAICRNIAEHNQSGWVWEYSMAYAHPALMRAVAATLKHETVALAELEDTAPAAGSDMAPEAPVGQIWASGSTYTTTVDDTTLADVGARLGVVNAYEELYKPNMAAIESAVRAAGFPAGSGGGQLLVPGIELKVP